MELYKNHCHTKVKYFSDDWVGSREDRRSTFGYCVFMGGNVVSWKNKKQNVVSHRSVDLEYRVVAQFFIFLVKETFIKKKQGKTPNITRVTRGKVNY